MPTRHKPKSLFDTVDILQLENIPIYVPTQYHQCYHQACSFLLSYQYNAATFKSFRKEIRIKILMM